HALARGPHPGREGGERGDVGHALLDGPRRRRVARGHPHRHPLVDPGRPAHEEARLRAGLPEVARRTVGGRRRGGGVRQPVRPAGVDGAAEDDGDAHGLTRGCPPPHPGGQFWGKGVGMSKFSVVVLCAVALVSACAPSAYEYGEYPAGVVEVDVAPPPPQYEVVPVAPGPGYIWVRGHWNRGGGAWAWAPGRYEAVRAGHRWESGRWVRGPRGRYAYVRGR